MSLGKPSIRALAHILRDARAQGDPATCELIASRIADYFFSQNRYFKREPFLVESGLEAVNALDSKNLLEAQQKTQG